MGGGLVDALADLFKGTVESAGKYLSREGSIQQWLRPTMSVIKDTPVIGDAVSSILKDSFEPEVGRAASFYRTRLGYKAEEAMKAAVHDTGEKYFGSRGEGLITLLHAAKHHGASDVHINNLADAFDLYLGEKGFSPPNWRVEAQKQFIPLKSTSSKFQERGPLEKASKELASWIFLPRIVIPHMTQPLNVVLYSGAKAASQAANEMFATGINTAKARVVLSGVLEESIYNQMMDTAKGGGLARKFFHMPGFNYAREIQITHAALAGEFALRDAFDEFVANGRVMTPRAKLVFDRMGIETSQLYSMQQLTPELIRTAQYRGAQATYFLRSGLDTPYPWGQNWMSRQSTLYKHFAYNQGRFMYEAIRDSFRASPEEGLKTIGIIGTLYPMAGIAVKGVTDAMDMRPAPRGKKEQEEAFEQYVDAIGHAAGFGIAYSMLRSAKRNKLAEWLVGPIAATGIDLTQDIINAPSSASSRRQLGRDVIRRIPFAGPALSYELLPKQKRSR